MTLEKLATLCETSVGTVSKAFSGSSEISEETRERIFKIARETGCFDKYNKNKYSKRVIAILCPEIISEYYTSIVECLSEEIRRRNGISLVCVTRFDSETETETYNYFSHYAKVDGIILIGVPSIMPENYSDIPTVSLGSHNNIDAFSLDFDDAILDAVNYLKSLGHTDISFAGEKLTNYKLSLFKSAMRRVGLPLYSDLIHISSTRFEAAGEEIADMILSAEKKPTAIIASYDHIAIGLIKRLKHYGYKVPDDFSVIGMDDIPVAPYLETALSSITPNREENLSRLVELLMRRIENKNQRIIGSKSSKAIFVARESTAPPRKHDI